MPDLSIEECKAEIMELHDYVLEKYNYEMQYLRPPCGEFSEVSLAAAQDLGYKTLMWSFAYVDWKVDNQPNASEALEKLTGAAHGIFFIPFQNQQRSLRRCNRFIACQGI